MSDLKPTKPLSGFIELLPAQQRCFDECVGRMQDVLKTAGFSHLDLPTIERFEVLTDKDDFEDIATEMYVFQKGDTKMGLRYDGTVGFARYVAGHMNDLVFPFRAYQFAKNYRAERPQKGRYREFYQIDLDILGIGELSVNYDVEIVATMAAVFKSIREYIGDTFVRIGSRPFWNAAFEYFGITGEDVAHSTMVLIDKKDKLSPADFAAALTDVIGAEKTKQILSVFSDGYKSLLNKNIKLSAAISELEAFYNQVVALGVDAVIDLSIMRGHGYYTGIVFEFYFKSKDGVATHLGGGGRYENLVGKFSKTKVIGVGAAFGPSRILVPLLEEGKIDLSKYETFVDAAVLIMGSENVPYAMSIVAALRDAKIVAIPYLDTEKKFKNQVEFADKIKSKFSIIIGEDEVKNKVLTVKDMATGNQEKMTVKEVVKFCRGA
ncbi:MAG: histidine--tRNA ligase [Proteobacteria bacterium]|nr:histidine--tRNA ligase [Pseudomonadota bacterium]